MKMVATHSYNAVPSMFTVAPMGSTKLAILRDTRELPVTACIVRGNVTIVEQVEKAVMSAEGMPR